MRQGGWGSAWNLALVWKVPSPFRTLKTTFKREVKEANWTKYYNSNWSHKAIECLLLSRFPCQSEWTTAATTIGTFNLNMRSWNSFVTGFEPCQLNFLSPPFISCRRKEAWIYSYITLWEYSFISNNLFPPLPWWNFTKRYWQGWRKLPLKRKERMTNI